MALCSTTLCLEKKSSKVGVHSIEEAIGRLKNYPIFIKEIKEVCEYLLTNLEVKTFAVGEGIL